MVLFGACSLTRRAVPSLAVSPCSPVPSGQAGQRDSRSPPPSAPWEGEGGSAEQEAEARRFALSFCLGVLVRHPQPQTRPHLAPHFRAAWPFPSASHRVQSLGPARHRTVNPSADTVCIIRSAG